MSLTFLVSVLFLTSPSTAQSRQCTDAIGHDRCQNLPEDTLCGDSSAYQVAPRMIGGHDAQRNQFPWMACLKRDEQLIYPTCFCGGSLISRTHVLTAAHCVKDNSNRIWVVLGDHNLWTDPDCTWYGDCAPPAQIYASKSISVHESYSNKTSINDIALIKLDKPAIINQYVLPICLPMSGFKDTDNMVLTVAGWGMVSLDGDFPPILKERNFNTTTLEECMLYAMKIIYAMKADGTTYAINEDKICTILDSDDGLLHAPWEGDSGGPAMAINTSGLGYPQYYLLGITSGVSPTIGSIAVFTRVTSYTTWILDHM